MTIIRAMTVLSILLFSTASIADHSWGGYHWEREANPLTKDLGDNVDSSWGYYLGVAAADWNASSVLEIGVTPGAATSSKKCDASEGHVEVCSDTYGFRGWLGVAGIYVSGLHITAGYVKLNNSYFDTSTYNTPEWRQLVACQEVGHIWGLDHQDEVFDNQNLGTCMDYTNDPGTNQHPNLHDYEELEAIYTHLDSSSVGGSGGGGGSGCNPKSPKCNGLSAADILASIEMNGPAQWGRLVSQHGPQEVYELDFGGGRKLITFVTWTLEHAYNHKH